MHGNTWAACLPADSILWYASTPFCLMPLHAPDTQIHTRNMSEHGFLAGDVDLAELAHRTQNYRWKIGWQGSGRTLLGKGRGWGAMLWSALERHLQL